MSEATRGFSIRNGGAWRFHGTSSGSRMAARGASRRFGIGSASPSSTRGPLHQDRHSQRQLPKKDRHEAHRRFRTALAQNSSSDARQRLRDLEPWLRGIHESAAESLLEARDDRLTLHRLKVPALLRKTLHATNPIESMFSTVRDAEGNRNRYQGRRMMPRGLASVLLYAEKGFKRITGDALIPAVIGTIEAEENTDATPRMAA